MADQGVKKEKLDTDQVVSEADVGINEFVNPDLKGFMGLIKQRFSDFQVNEIDLDGNVVILKTGEIAEQLSTNSSNDQETNSTNANDASKTSEEKLNAGEEVSEPSGPQITPDSNEDLKKLCKIISQKNVQKCCDLLNNSKNQINRIQTDPILDKDARTKVHGLVRTGFESKLETNTDKNCIVLTKVHKRSRKRKMPKNKSSASGKGDFLHFTLYKENKETMEAIGIMSRFLHIPPRAIQFAGTKDRRAATTQRVSWRYGELARISPLNSKLKTSIRVGDFQFKSDGLRLGCLTGNQFGIVIRNISPESVQTINDAFTSLRVNGFVNYFGLQRFGTFSTSSHHVGMHILAEDFDGAVNSLLSVQDVTNEESREAREVWAKEHDAAKALALMPKRCLAEYNILEALCQSSSGINALLRVPHSLKTMYVHAYQSYVWNNVASARVRLGQEKRKELGGELQVLKGDFVMCDETENDDNEAQDRVQRARPITDEEIAANKYSIYDIVLPTPGFDITYPENMVSQYEEIMAKDNIDCHKMRRNIKEFSLFGTYRNVFAKPLFVDWSVRKYVNDEDTVLYTDRERVELNSESKLAPEPVENSEQDLKLAAVLSMGLSTSQYATMALREAMKQETSRNGAIYFA